MYRGLSIHPWKLRQKTVFKKKKSVFTSPFQYWKPPDNAAIIIYTKGNAQMELTEMCDRRTEQDKWTNKTKKKATRQLFQLTPGT